MWWWWWVLYAAYQAGTKERWINRRRCVGGREDPAQHTHTHGAAAEISCLLCDAATQSGFVGATKITGDVNLRLIVQIISENYNRLNGSTSDSSCMRACVRASSCYSCEMMGEWTVHLGVMESEEEGGTDP